VLAYVDTGAFCLMKARLQMGQEGYCGFPPRLPVGPPAMAAQLVLHIAPDPLPQVPFRGVGRQKAWAEAVLPRLPPSEGLTAFVIAASVQHHDQLLLGPGLPPLRQEGHEGLTVLPAAQPPVSLARGIVQGPKPDACAVRSGGRHSPRLAPLVPHVCQPGRAVDCACVHIDQSNPTRTCGAFFLSQSST
jgi:hypothetical protein